MTDEITLKYGETENGSPELIQTMTERGIEGLVESHPEVYLLELTGFPNAVIPETIGNLKNLRNFVVTPAVNLPESLKECKELELLALPKSPDLNVDISFLKDNSKLQVVNIAGSPNVTGYQALEEAGIMIITS